jgi:hypothetical protein
VPLPGHGIGLPPTVRYRGRCSGGVPSLLPPVSGARSGTPSLASHPGPGVLHMSVAQLLFLMAPARLRPAGLPPIRGRQAERSKGCTYRDGPQRVQRLPIAASRISRRRACRQWQLLSHVRDGRGAGRAAGDRHAVSRAPSSTLSSNQGLQWSLCASRQEKVVAVAVAVNQRDRAHGMSSQCLVSCCAAGSSAIDFASPLTARLCAGTPATVWSRRHQAVFLDSGCAPSCRCLRPRGPRGRWTVRAVGDAPTSLISPGQAAPLLTRPLGGARGECPQPQRCRGEEHNYGPTEHHRVSYSAPGGV